MATRSPINESADDEADEDAVEQRPLPTKKKPHGLRGRWRAVKTWWREARWWVLPATLAGAGVWFVFGVAALWFPRAFGPDMAGAFASMGAFTSYFFLAGFLLFMVVAYLAAGYLLKRKEFARLVNTKSKGDFIRQQDKIERLAFELGHREQDLVAARKKDFRIRH